MPRESDDLDRDRRRRERSERRGSRTAGEESSHERDREHIREENRERRRRRGHRATDSSGHLLTPQPRGAGYPSDSDRETSTRRKSAPRTRRSTATPGTSTPSTSRSSGAPLSLDAITKLDKSHQKKAGWSGYDYDEDYLKEVRRKEEKLEKERLKALKEEKKRERERNRAYESEAAIEEVRIRREKKERDRRKAAAISATDDERAKRRSANTDDERGKRRSASKDDERANRRSARADNEKQKKTTILANMETERTEGKAKRLYEKQHRSEMKQRRLVSGPLAEEGGIDDDESQYMMDKRGGGGSSVPSDDTEEELARKKKKKRICNDKTAASTTSASSSGTPSNSNLNNIDPASIPDSAKGGILDPFSWYDTTDFNVTYTAATVGGLPIMGLNSTWDDDVTANSNVPNLQDSFKYGTMPIRGVNVGGWLNIEPFITPSFFESYGSSDGIVDEYTLVTKLGAAKAKSTLEQHYDTFVTKQTFADIRAAGFDHVRIPFGYWAVTTYTGDPYVKQVSWRYLLRGIEYARQNGLRVNLDLHGAPGSQNGWNHSGRQGVIGWLNGTDGDLNAQRTLDIHHQLSVFFAQPRYKNIITLYGILNEPRMVDLNTNDVVAWTQKAITQIRADNITAIIVFGDGFRGLDNWQGVFTGQDGLLLDVHQYVIFNVDQLSLKHTDKLNFACAGWTAQSKRSMDTSTGFGPTMCGEWSQADTDCTEYINDVNIGTRWEGTYDTGNVSTSITVPQCPGGKSCTCVGANADPSKYSAAYKQWLYQFAIAQMISFEAGWGWFYWTWQTEKAPQWSYKAGMASGILPAKTWDRNFNCSSTLDDYGKMGLSETY
ncbi:glycoside hydrolase family 5 protein [Pleomassaria siparia CBS 279.74]|uniref:glucan 1,3-beta-glucosidase n=1 Tax=Pleomassaria siparia CBS 279.74 TaxID=1314801 RepID=A0A6G1KLJ2_9PLEO|nr:glycoside hydrolase family 5 protein [Pleomassaria siparia CBS 279.74]